MLEEVSTSTTVYESISRWRYVASTGSSQIAPRSTITAQRKAAMIARTRHDAPARASWRYMYTTKKSNSAASASSPTAGQPVGAAA